MEFVSRTPIEKGWSPDKKYRVRTVSGRDHLLRVSAHETYGEKRREFELMERFAALGVPMCRPIEFGENGEGVYSVQEWIDGEDAEAVVPRLDPRRQYGYGLEAGRILRLIHTLPAPPEAEDWEARMDRKLDARIKKYLDCPLRYDDDRPLLDYLALNRAFLKNRPQVWQHGDYHIGNMMVDRSGHLRIIDFNRFDWGDPWEEFKRIVWCAQASPLFASGRIGGYFDGPIPEDFWRTLALHICSASISSLPWAIPFGEAEVATMRRQEAQILLWYDNMRRVIPSWYAGNRK